MKESDSNMHLLYLAKQDLKVHTSILREALVNLQAKDRSPAFLKMVSENAQALISITQFDEFSPLKPLIQALNHYFEAVQAGLEIDPSQIELLSNIVGDLARFAETDLVILKKTLQARQNSLDQMILRLNHFSQYFKPKSILTPQPSAEQMKEQTSSLINYTLATTFLQELSLQFPLLKQNFENFQINHQDKNALKNISKIVQTIKQAGKIIHFDSIVQLSDALENVINILFEYSDQWTSHVQDLIAEALDILKELSQVKSPQLPLFVQDRTEHIYRVSQHLKNSFKENFQQYTKKIVTPDKGETTIDSSMFDLFCIELETQCAVLNHGLVSLEQNPQDTGLLELLMRGAHSIKGAARVLSLDSIVRLAHALEDCFVAAQNQPLEMEGDQIDILLQGVDLLTRLSKIKLEDLPNWLREQQLILEKLIIDISQLKNYSKRPLAIAKKILGASASADKTGSTPFSVKASIREFNIQSENIKPFSASYTQDRFLRVSAQNLNRLMGLAGESLVESRWLYPFSEGLQKFRQSQNKLTDQVDFLRDRLQETKLSEKNQQYLTDLQYSINDLRQQLTEQLRELDAFIRSHASLSDRLYQEVVTIRMRPFADGVEAFPRMVRDLAHQLGKRVKLEIEGKITPVDRDILEKLESPLSHLLRNAVDHGIEHPQKRIEMGKPAEGWIKLEAHHRGGLLSISVSDDGQGLNVDEVRRKIIEKKLAKAETVERFTDKEIIDFLFLPGFSTSEHVTEISGRGVGLNIVQNIVQELGGAVRAFSVPGKGMSFHLQLPLTLSVIRTLLVEISGESYAFPLARIEQALLVRQEELIGIENRQFFRYEGKNIGLVLAWQVLELNEPTSALKDFPVVVISDHTNYYGLVVDRLIGEKELVVQELDPRLGKVTDIIAGALMEDGSPVLIINIEDIMHSIDHMLSGGHLTKVLEIKEKKALVASLRILVVDDSITVREVECRLLRNKGYEVDTAVNGLDGWNAIRIGHYNLVITDLDMPRMNGIDLVRAIKSDPNLQNIPVMIVSYKEGEEERIKGLEAGADYYLTKSSFDDATLLEAVKDLIGLP